MSETDIIRSLGHFERYCVTRHNLGFASAVTILGTFHASPESLRTALIPRVQELLDLYPHLSCRIANSKTAGPGFARRATGLTPDQVIAVQNEEAVTRHDRAQRAGNILNRELQFMANIDIEQDPLFRVAIYPLSDGRSCQASLTYHHVLSDGGGTRNLFEAISSSSTLAEETLSDTGIPSSLEATRPTKPSSSYLLPIVFTELLLPKLPRFISSWFSSPPIWPQAQDIRKRPIDCEKAYHIFYFDDSNFVLGLKRAGAKVGVKTIQGLVHAAATVALYLAVTEVGNKREAHLKTGTPMGVRDRQDPKHGAYTGNFLANYEWSVSCDDDTPLWAKAKEYASGLTHPSALQNALYAMGMLSLIPSASSPSATRRSNEYTSWETYFQEKVDSPNPFSVSLEISNIGTLSSQDLIYGARDLCWAQPAAPTGHAMSLNVLGTKEESGSGTLSITLAWRKGSLDESLMKAFRRNFEMIMMALKQGRDGLVREDVTFGVIRDVLQSESGL